MSHPHAYPPRSPNVRLKQDNDSSGTPTDFGLL